MNIAETTTGGAGAHPGAGRPPAARLAAASFVGTALEFFDFYAYGLAAALVLDQVFFPALDPVAGTLASFSTFAVAFLARPLGAVLFGHLGDRLGRRNTLVASLVVMGAATLAIGLLPGYTELGVVAPALLVLLRFVQGLGVGGEWGGAALLATEHAPPGRRGRYALFTQLGPPAGFLLANSAFLVLDGVLAPSAFVTWGWRVPFLVSAVLVLVGLYVRLRIPEPPTFRRAAVPARRSPLGALLRGQPRQLLLGAGVMVVQYTLFYLATAYCLSYGTSVLGMDRGLLLALTMAAVAGLAIMTALAALASDRWGRRPVLVCACVVSAGWALVFFPLFDTADPTLVALALVGALLAMGLGYGPMGAHLPELFDATHRYTGAALAYSLGGVLGGALTPLIAVRLQASIGSGAVGAYLVCVALVSLGCALASRDTGSRSGGADPMSAAAPS
ncbi:MFS transporter [Actinoalloteichus caeruleus]|uniref:MFS transporter n=1 Tax=Actinoalloteichus cyanogriseus TaxID=2893586 RepID=UPI003BB8F38B